MEFILMGLPELLLLGEVNIYAHQSNGAIESFRILNNTLEYFEEEEWKQWAPYENYSIRQSLEEYLRKVPSLKFYILNEE